MDTFLTYSLASLAIALITLGMLGIISSLGHPKAEFNRALVSETLPSISEPWKTDEKQPTRSASPTSTRARTRKHKPSQQDVESRLAALCPEVDKLRDDLLALRRELGSVMASARPNIGLGRRSTPAKP